MQERDTTSKEDILGQGIQLFRFSATYFFEVPVQREEGQTEEQARRRAQEIFFSDPLRFITPEDIQRTAEIEDDEL